MGENNKKFGDNYLKQNGIDAHEVKEDYDCGLCRDMIFIMVKL